MKKIDSSNFIDLAIQILLIGGFISFEVFNIYTTREGLHMIMKNNFAAVVFAIAIASTDLGGLSRVFSARGPKTLEEKIVSVAVLGVWMLVATMNALLTWWTVQTNFEASPPTGPASMAGSSVYMSSFISLLVLCVHMAMIYSVTVYVSMHIQRGPNVYTQRQPQHQSQGFATRPPIQQPQGFASRPPIQQPQGFSARPPIQKPQPQQVPMRKMTEDDD
jgi:hypothetical protein